MKRIIEKQAQENEPDAAVKRTSLNDLMSVDIDNIFDKESL